LAMYINICYGLTMARHLNIKRLIVAGLIFAFLGSPLHSSHAQEYLTLPVPGIMVNLSPAFNPPVLKGIKVYPDNPFRFDFILDKGDSKLANGQLKNESSRLIKYFLASLTVPEKDLWVNLSPYEKDRIVPEDFGQTQMGRDLLAEDYMLKQITASLIYPENKIGKEFWDKVYAEAMKRYGTTNVPVNTFNKVWIVPEKATVYENKESAFVVDSKLKVMLEQDYLALEKNTSVHIFENGAGGQSKSGINALGSQIIRQIVIPALEKEVNEGQNFAQLRQVYNSLILATWFKHKIKDSIMSRAYVGRAKIAGIDVDDKQADEKIYLRYLQAFKKGVFNYIREDIPLDSQASDIKKQGIFPRKYFSGGADLDKIEKAYQGNSNARSLPRLDNAMTIEVNAKAIDGDFESGSYKSLLTVWDEVQPSNIKIEKRGRFYLVTAPGRKGRRQPARPFESVTTPFDPDAFNFNKIPSDEILWEGMFQGKTLTVIKQLWPFAEKHVLFVLQRSQDRPQIIQEDDLKLAIGIVRNQPLKGFRLAFNSLKAGASVNHFHMQGFVVPAGLSPLENAKTTSLYLDDGISVERLDGYPANGLFFQGEDADKLSEITGGFIRYLQRREIAHSVSITPKGIYVLPVNSNYVTTFGNTWSFYELMGFILHLNDGQDANGITEQTISEEMKKVTIREDEFSRLCHAYFSLAKFGLHLTFRQVVFAGGAKLILPANISEADVSAFEEGPNDYKITIQSGGSQLQPAEHWGYNSTGFSLLNERLKLLESIQGFAKDRKDAKIPIDVLDWGCGDGTGLVALKKELGRLKIDNVELIGFSDKLYSEWKEAPQGITFITDIKYLEGKKVRLIYSHLGIHHLLEKSPREISIVHLMQLRTIMDKKGILRMFPPNNSPVELLKAVFPSVRVIDEQDGDYEGAFYAEASLANKKDLAMVRNGGIDFDPNKMDLNIQNSSNGIKFNVDPAMLQRIQNASGFTPVIVNIRPMTDLRIFLGLTDSSQNAPVSS